MQRGLRQAAFLLLVALIVGAVVAGLWTAVKADGFRVPFAVALMAMGGLLGLSGSNALSRAGSMDTFAFLGRGPESADPYAGEGLTNLGLFLFVGLPLFAAGLVLFGSG